MTIEDKIARISAEEAAKLDPNRKLRDVPPVAPNIRNADAIDVRNPQHKTDFTLESVDEYLRAEVLHPGIGLGAQPAMYVHDMLRWLRGQMVDSTPMKCGHKRSELVLSEDCGCAEGFLSNSTMKDGSPAHADHYSGDAMDPGFDSPCHSYCRICREIQAACEAERERCAKACDEAASLCNRAGLPPYHVWEDDLKAHHRADAAEIRRLAPSLSLPELLREERADILVVASRKCCAWCMEGDIPTQKFEGSLDFYHGDFYCHATHIHHLRLAELRRGNDAVDESV